MTQSMTAFARYSEHGKWGTIIWDIRSVNHRYLDCSFRLPESCRHLETQLRELIHTKLQRGKVECFLKYSPGDITNLEVSINKNLVKQLSLATKDISRHFEKTSATINPLQVLSWNNVLQITERNSEILDKKVLSSFSKALNHLITGRKKEGLRLQETLSQRLILINNEIAKVKKSLPKIITKHKNKIRTQIKDACAQLDNSRLEQEMVYFVQKIDVAEEIDRIKIHSNEIKQILKSKNAIGKRLDFLIQELNREANTLASKSADKITTHAAVELKVLIEQMREQVQNIE